MSSLTQVQSKFGRTYFRKGMSEGKSVRDLIDEYTSNPESSINLTDSRFSFDREEELKSERVVTSRWHPLRRHKIQQDFLTSITRFNVVPAGRRSGKTEIGKRRLIRKAITNCKFSGARFIAAAPTHAQAKRIFWADLKAFVPKKLQITRPSESLLTLYLFNGSVINVLRFY